MEIQFIIITNLFSISTWFLLFSWRNSIPFIYHGYLGIHSRSECAVVRHRLRAWLVIKLSLQRAKICITYGPINSSNNNWYSRVFVSLVPAANDEREKRIYWRKEKGREREREGEDKLCYNLNWNVIEELCERGKTYQNGEREIYGHRRIKM